MGPFLSHQAGQDARMKHCIALEKPTETTVASFGSARLVKTKDGYHELRGGSRSDSLEAREWVSIFMHEVVIRIN